MERLKAETAGTEAVIVALQTVRKLGDLRSPTVGVLIAVLIEDLTTGRLRLVRGSAAAQRELIEEE